MKHSKLNKIDDDLIDVVELFEVLWEGKWKIILVTFAFALLPFIYLSTSENLTKGFVNVRPADPSLFLNYAALNKTIGSEYEFLQIKPDVIFKKFVKKFNENEEVR